VGEFRTVCCPNSYLGPANDEMLLLSDDHVIITVFLVVFFWVRAYHCSVLFSPVPRFIVK